eukprot:COSAG03_NODE_11426_length_593_cov_1.461538_2_plen_44_part_01
MGEGARHWRNRNGGGGAALEESQWGRGRNGGGVALGLGDSGRHT